MIESVCTGSEGDRMELGQFRAGSNRPYPTEFHLAQGAAAGLRDPEPILIPRIEIAAANIASEKVFGLADAPPVGALADHRPARSRFFK
jgi:hypothetical protein